MTQYRVVDARGNTIAADHVVMAQTPEEAGRTALGVDLVRSGRLVDLVARIYWQTPGNPQSMVRLYSKSAFAR